MPQRLVFVNNQRPLVYILSLDETDVQAFPVQISGVDDGIGPDSIFADEENRLITTARRSSPQGWFHYHYDPEGEIWVRKDPQIAGAAWQIRGSSYQNVWSFPGQTELLYHWNGSNWIQDANVGGNDLQDLSVFGSGLNDVVAVAGDAIWLRTSGSRGSGVWSNQYAQMISDIGFGTSIRIVHAISADEIYLGVNNGGGASQTMRIVKWNGSVWAVVATGATGAWAFYRGKGSNIGSKIWAGTWDGSGAGIWHYNGGSSLVRQRQLVGGFLGHTVLMVDDLTGYSVGEGGAIPQSDRWFITKTTDGVSHPNIINDEFGWLGSIHGAAFWGEPPVVPDSPAGFFGQMPINADNNGLTVDGTPTNLTDGSWYTYHPLSAQSLVDHLAAVITASASSATVTASVDSDGFLTLEGTASFDVTNFEAYDLFGFASNSLTGGSSYTATKRLEGSWFPGRLESAVMAPVSKQGKPRSLVAQQQAADKTAYTITIGQLIFQSLTFEYISKVKAWDDDGARSSFTGFFETIRDGRKILFVPNWTGTGLYSIYHEYIWNLKDQPSPDIKRQAKTRTTDLYWTIVFNLRGV